VFYTVVLTPHQTGIGDFYYYHDLANVIAQGYGFEDPSSVLAGHGVPTALHPPLWPELLSFVSRLGGEGAPIHSYGSHGYIAHRLTGAFVGSGTVVAVGYLGRRTAGPRVGLIAAFLAAVYPVLIAADGSLLTESLFGLCTAVAMLLAYRVLDNPASWSALALGAAIGLASLARSEGLLLLPLLALPVLLRRGASAQKVAGRVALTCLGVAVVIAPWTIRNTVRFDQLVIGANTSGSYIGGANCDATFHGRNIGLWDIRCVAPPTSSNEAVNAARQRRQGIEYAKDHSGRLPAVIAVRVLRTWDFYQPWRDVKFLEGRNWTASRVGLFAYWLLLPLAIAGMLMLRRRGEPLRVLLAPIVLATLVPALGYGLPRFRHLAEISIVILAAVVLSALYDRLRAGRLSAIPTRSSRAAST
jgi:4-amino-4-deoxy-L-arabinose transferase-like glycosyltransferase